MDYFEALELIARVVGMDPDAGDFSERAAESALWDRHSITVEDFQKVAELLVPFTFPAKTFGGNWWQGYIADGAFIYKQPSKLEVKD